MDEQRSGLTDAEEAALVVASAVGIKHRQAEGMGKIAPEAAYPALLAALGGPMLEAGLPADEVIERLAALARPGLMEMTSPRFFGWVIGASHPAGVAADWMASAWGQNAPSSVATPAAAAAEETAGRWMLDLLDLPREAGFGFTTGATMANAIGLAAARNEILRRAGWDVEADGLFGAPEVNVVLGSEAHSTVFMSLRLLGFGERRVITVAADDQGRMIPDALAEALAPLQAPVIVIAQAGHINSGAFDPFPSIVPLARAKGAWIHVDGAFGLWARTCPDVAAQARGVDLCDSWATDGHKWLQTPYDCGFVFVRDAAALTRAMSLEASYLSEVGKERQPRNTTPELSRRARGFAAWAVLKTLGRAGVAEMVGRHCAVARAIAEGLSAEPGFEVLNEVCLNQVAVSCTGADGQPDDEATEALLKAVQEDGRCYPSHGIWKDRQIIRFSVSSNKTSLADAAEALEIVTALRREQREASA